MTQSNIENITACKAVWGMGACQGLQPVRNMNLKKKIEVQLLVNYQELLTGKIINNSSRFRGFVGTQSYLRRQQGCQPKEI